MDTGFHNGKIGRVPRAVLTLLAGVCVVLAGGCDKPRYRPSDAAFEAQPLPEHPAVAGPAEEPEPRPAWNAPAGRR